MKRRVKNYLWLMKWDIHFQYFLQYLPERLAGVNRWQSRVVEEWSWFPLGCVLQTCYSMSCVRQIRCVRDMIIPSWASISTLSHFHVTSVNTEQLCHESALDVRSESPAWWSRGAHELHQINKTNLIQLYFTLSTSLSSNNESLIDKGKYWV